MALPPPRAGSAPWPDPAASGSVPPPAAGPPIRLPPPTSSATSVTAALPTPEQVAEIQRRLAASEPARAEAARRHRRRRRRRISAAAAALGVLGSALLFLAVDVVDLADSADGAPDRRESGFVLELDHARLTFPERPESDMSVEDVDGFRTFTTVYEVENEEYYLNATHSNFPGVAAFNREEGISDEVFAESLIDMALGGMARGLDGTLERSEPFTADGVLRAQRAEIDTSLGRLFVEIYVFEDAALTVMGGGDGDGHDDDDIRPEYQALLDSIVFTP